MREVEPVAEDGKEIFRVGTLLSIYHQRFHSAIAISQFSNFQSV